MKTKAEIYAQRVLDGKEVVGQEIYLAAERFFDLCKRYRYNREEANRVVDWFENNLVHWEGAWRGKPFILEPWQCFVIQPIFALMNGERRLINNSYTQIARKNTKTTLSAGIALFHLIADHEQSPQVLVGANNEDQAKICTTCAANIIRQSPKLNAHYEVGNIKIFYYKDTCVGISFPKKDGKIIPMTKEVKTKDGFNPSLGVIDEYHEAQTNKLLNVIESGQGARMNPLSIVITTAGFNKEGPCYSQLRKVSREILQGQKEDDSMWAIIYEPGEQDDWQVLETWKKANPNYGVSVYEHYLDSRYKKARNEGATKEVDFKTKNLNIWTNAASVWIQDEIWMKGDKEVRHDLIYKSGLDMAYKRDWSSWVLDGEDEEGNHHIIPYFWIPQSIVDDIEQNHNSNIKDWIDQGYVFVTPGNITDHNAIHEFIEEKRKEYQIESCAADPAYCVGLMTKMNDSGFETMELTQTPTKLTQPTTQFYELVKEGKLIHGGNPVLRWMISNCVLRVYSNGLIKVHKENEEHGKIDGIAAAINAEMLHIIGKEEDNFLCEIW